mmetsp:Transcript_20204/g.34501  ORF Transcript_20204/g.34501 Transcript_20204/m.34501 type:complete len:82 (+) Transcript_20204:193-438(+)
MEELFQCCLLFVAQSVKSRSLAATAWWYWRNPSSLTHSLTHSLSCSLSPPTILVVVVAFRSFIPLQYSIMAVNRVNRRMPG